MPLVRPALWWPIPVQSEATAAQNNYLEFFIRTGSGPYTYYGTTNGTTATSGAAQPAYGFVVGIDTETSTLSYPYGYEAWRTIYRYCAAIKTAMEAVTGPTGFSVDWDVSDEGLLELTASSNDAGTAIRFRWSPATSPATSYLQAAAVLGFDPADEAYAASHSAVEVHAGGFYLASDSGAALRRFSGFYTANVKAFESVSIYGQFAGASIGGQSKLDMGFTMLSDVQAAALRDCHSYAVEGGGLALHTDGAVWADMALGWAFARESREGFKPEMAYAGIARWNADLSLTQRG